MVNQKVGRNDPCPCGSGKKFKQCCQKLPGTKKITAKVIKSGPQESQEHQGPDLIKRAFGQAFAQELPKDKESPKSE